MVSTPWLDHEVTMSEAAELGTTRVIREHSTIGVVVTTDGSITDIPREDYIEAEGRVIRELQEIGKPFLVLLNATEPESDRVQTMARDIASRYGVTCLPVNCLTLDDNAVGMILKAILYEFPLCELDLFIPPWVEALADDHPIKSGLYQAIRENTGSLHCIREVQGAISAIGGCESVSSARIKSIQLGTGVAAAELQLPRALFYRTLSEQSGFDVKDDGDLLSLLTELSLVKAEYDKVAQAVFDARERGYGIVVPTVDELNLEEPEIMKQGGRYGVRLKASAPSLHIIRADIETTVSPIVGNEKQSEDMVNYLLQEFEGDTTKIWQSNIFGRSFHEIVNEDLQAKLKHMPDDARLKLRQMERLGQVVVRTCVQSLHFVSCFAACRKDKHGSFIVHCPKFPQYGHSIRAGQVDIKQDQVVTLNGKQLTGFISIAACVCFIAVQTQLFRDIVTQGFFIFNNK